MGPKKSNPKNGHIKEGKTTRQKTSKNRGKVHKKSKKPKNVKNRQKTSKNPRNRDTVYIYIGKSHFSGYSNIGSRRWKIILGKSPPTPISSRVGITWLPGRKNKSTKKRKSENNINKRSTDCQQSDARELLHLSMGQR